MASLNAALASHRAAFATLYGIAPADQVMTNAKYLSLLSGIVQFVTDTGVKYVEGPFVSEIVSASSLYNAISANSYYKSDIAVITGIASADQDPVANSAYRYFLSGVVNGPGYIQADYL